MASVTAITLNALLTIIWVHVRTGQPAVPDLLRTLVRSVLVTALAGGATALGLAVLRTSVPWALAQCALGGFFYGAFALVAVRGLGDSAMRQGLEAFSGRVRAGIRGRSG